MADPMEQQDAALEADDTQKDKYLTFLLEKELYAIDIKHVIEIIGIQPITEVPELPEYIIGIINLRGKIIPVMDVRKRFNKPFRPYNDRTCIVVIEVQEISVGLIVDSVAEVMSIPAQDVVELPQVKKNSHRFIKGIGKSGNEVKMLLDCDKLLNQHDLEELEQL